MSEDELTPMQAHRALIASLSKEDEVTGWEAMLEALEAEDAKITELEQAVVRAQQEFQVQAARYAAVRDMLRNAIRHDPYCLYVAGDASPIGEGLVSDGRFRFLLMPIGQAVLQILAEANISQPVQEIKKALLKGGVPHVDGRAINAALMTLVRTGRVHKRVGLGNVAYFEAFLNQWGLDLHSESRPADWRGTPNLTPEDVAVLDEEREKRQKEIIEAREKMARANTPPKLLAAEPDASEREQPSD